MSDSVSERAESQLRRAARSAAAALGEHAESLEALAAEIARRASGAGQAVALPARAGKLLGPLRAELIREWKDDPRQQPDAPESLAILLAFDGVAAAIGGADFPDADRSFAQWLSGPGGLELVVEVAHDLRSPLTSILFLAETLQRGQSGPVTELQVRQLGLIYSAGLGLSTLASNVMELARGGTRLADDRPAPFSVTDVLESVADIVRPMAEEKGLSVRILPPTSDHRLGPSQALSRVLLNLTTNAIKFTEEGFVEIVARPTTLTDIEFSVRDSGHGVTDEALDTLFEPFRKGPRGTGMLFSGTGLGLALCKKLVEAMGSRLDFESAPEWGTRFYFLLNLPPVSSS